MKTVVTLLIVLLCLGARNGVRCAELQAEAAQSPELEQANKLSIEAASLFDWHKLEGALASAKRALELREKVLGPNHELVASSLNLIANIYVAVKKYDTAEPLYRRSLSILEKKWGPDSKFLTTTIESLALVRFALQDNGGAEKFYLRSLAIKEKALGPDDPSTEKTVGTLGLLYERTDKPAKAAEFFKRQLAIAEKVLGPDNPGLLEPLYKCICASLAANKPSEAKEYESRAEKLVAPAAPLQKGPVLQGNAIVRVQPEYPAEARRRRESGAVVVEIKVDECGRVFAARALSGNADLIDASVKAARQWRFNSIKVDGRPIKVIGTLTFHFSL